jgi:Asp/Glu/hydantoin racemase
VILLINPNTNTATTEMMTDRARQYLRGTGYELRGHTVSTGPAMIVEPDALEASATYVVNCVHEAADDSIVGVIVGAIGDPGVAALRAELAIPVIGIGEAAVRAAAVGGRRFGMATSTDELADSLRELVAAHSAAEQFTGLRLTVSGPTVLAADAERQFRELRSAVQQCSALDGAEAVIIGGGPLSDSARELAGALAIAIVEPIPSAVAAMVAMLPDRIRV